MDEVVCEIIIFIPGRRASFFLRLAGIVTWPRLVRVVILGILLQFYLIAAVVANICKARSWKSLNKLRYICDCDIDECFVKTYNTRQMRKEQSVPNQLTSISSRNQTVVPSSVRKQLGTKPGDRLTWSIVWLNNKPKAIVEPAPSSWTEHMRGLGAEVWKKVDIETYIQQLREEWQPH